MPKAKLGPPIDEVQSLTSGASLRDALVDDFTGEAIATVSRSVPTAPKPKAKTTVVIKVRHKGPWRRM